MVQRQLLIVFFPMLSAVIYAQQEPKVQVATGKEVHIRIVQAGATICEGGEPSTEGAPCSAGTKRIWIWNRMSELEYQETTGSAADLLKGKNVTVVHCNLDQNYYGHCWGSFEWTVPGKGGRWEGVWSTTADMMRGIVINSATGYGYGGELEGLQLKFDAVNPGGLPYSILIAKVTPK